LPKQRLNLAVGIATVGRREVLAQTIDFLARQSRLPDQLVICSVSRDDIDQEALERFPSPSLVVLAPLGLPAQRNRILAAISDADVVIFLDDDFLANCRYLANLESIFLANSDVVGATGHILADGATGPGLNFAEGVEIIKSDLASGSVKSGLVDFYGAYGCNMCFRIEPIRRNEIRFDENLPLYGWQEDIDFALRLTPYGRVIKADALRGVHLGIKLGRASGVRLGYSQIANPVYLIRKGTMSWKHARMLMWRNLAANFVKSFHPEPWIDRKGRLKGNVLALIDVALGRSSPGRVLQLD